MSRSRPYLSHTFSLYNLLRFCLLSPEQSCRQRHFYPGWYGRSDGEHHTWLSVWRWLSVDPGETSSCLTNTLTVSRRGHRNPRLQVCRLEPWSQRANVCLSVFSILRSGRVDLGSGWNSCFGLWLPLGNMSFLLVVFNITVCDSCWKVVVLFQTPSDYSRTLWVHFQEYLVSLQAFCPHLLWEDWIFSLGFWKCSFVFMLQV